MEELVKRTGASKKNKKANENSILLKSKIVQTNITTLGQKRDTGWQ